MHVGRLALLASVPCGPALRRLRGTARACVADDAAYMRLALTQAHAAFAEGEVPIGAVLVREGKVIGVGRNRVERDCDASAHAELLCLRSSAAALGAWRLEGTTLYCSVEPCPMCAAAIRAFRVERLVYGTANPRLGAFESGMATANPFAPCLTVESGVLAEQASELMRVFFLRARGRRPYAERANEADSHLDPAYGSVQQRLRRAVRRFTRWAWL
ncbi:hypothetical protein AB1Y20_001707 [Prymnesium parvum]|uniref:tRNA(adenine(34)) deaminase n=1 Tax=Prymnesium parvum TaxID=97485 RepID=A0AB34K922_PRYPA